MKVFNKLIYIYFPSALIILLALNFIIKIEYEEEKDRNNNRRNDWSLEKKELAIKSQLGLEAKKNNISYTEIRTEKNLNNIVYQEESLDNLAIRWMNGERNLLWKINKENGEQVVIKLNEYQTHGLKMGSFTGEIKEVPGKSHALLTHVNNRISGVIHDIHADTVYEVRPTLNTYSLELIRIPDHEKHKCLVCKP